ncbi:MAG TPA: phosphate ABC transporter permease PstA [Nocardioides sp.]|nr:phosphate ABC transporter permease PstA [Nocardioides sp.]
MAREEQATTVLPDRDFSEEVLATREDRRLTSGVRIGDLLHLVGALVAAAALTGILGSQLAPVHGLLANLAIGYLFFLGLYALLVWLDEPGPVVGDRVISVVIQSGAFLLVLALVSVMVFTVIKGFGAVVHLNLLTQDMSSTGPSDPLSKGGVIQGIVGTLIEISIALAITIPLGITAALYLNEVPGRMSRFVRTIVEAMTALPSIVAGLFVLATVILALGFDKSGFAAGLAITVMMLPIMIRAADVVIRLVPSTLKEASLGLGAGQLKTVLHVVLPTARSGLTTAVILATARGIGETSPVLLTSGFAQSLNANPFKGPMVSLPLDVFQFKSSPEPAMVSRAFGAAVVLLVLVLVLFVAARVAGAQDVAKKAKGRQRRAALVARFRSLTASLTTRSSSDA